MTEARSEAMTTQAATVERPCPVCQTENPNPPPGRYGRDGWSAIACRNCGFVHMQTVPATGELVETFAWEKTFQAEAKRRKTKHPIFAWLDGKTRWRLHLFKRTEGVDILNQRAAPGPALDLGCGSGGAFGGFAPHLIPHGIEISQTLAERAATVAAGRGGSVIQGSSAEGLTRFPDDYFTAALLRSYLEHDWQAREVVHNLYRKMAPGGLAVVKVPNYGSLNRRLMQSRWCGFRFPDHVNYFEKSSLRRLAEDARFAVEIPLLQSLPTDDNMLAVLMKPSLAEGRLP